MRRLVLLTAVLVHALAAAPITLRWSSGRLVEAVRYQGEGVAEARQRVFGREWSTAVEAIAATIPPHGEYLLIPALGVETGAALWLRHDLAPRRPILVPTDLTTARSRLAQPHRRHLLTDHAVIVYGYDDPPRLVRTSNLIAGEEP